VRNPLAAHPPWRQLAIIAVALPLVIVLAVLAFAWPAAHIAPRNLPVGLVGPSASSQPVLTGLTRSDPGGFDVRLYAGQGSARAAIRDRDVYGAFVVATGSITVLEASTAGLIALIGGPGLALGVIVMVLIGNPFSAATSAPELLPAPVGTIGQWLPPGAGANLIRSTAYFGGHGAAGQLTVLLVWIVFGLVAVAVGHHAPVRFAARRAWKPAPPRTARELASAPVMDGIGPGNPGARTTARSG
jgi:hypothetical protein